MWWFVSGRRYRMKCEEYAMAKGMVVEQQHRAHRAEVHAVQLREHLDWERQERLALVEAILNLKREGFLPQPPQGGAVPRGPDLPAEIEAALVERAGRDPALFTRLARSAMVDLQQERDPRDIAAGILKGSTLNPFLL